MNKLDFMNRLRAALTGRLSAEQVQDHVNYYEDYINTQIRLGKREDEVMASLGDPRLIAKTIIEASGVGDFEEADYQSEGYRSNIYQHQNNNYNNYVKERRLIRLPGWLWAVIVILILIVVLGLVFTLLSAFAPLICVILVVVGLMKFFDWLN